MRVAIILLLLLSGTAHADVVVEAGAGWQNTGAIREMKWLPGIQGSRKDVPAFVGIRLAGKSRLYYSANLRLQYTNAWSMGGAVNLLGASAGVAGLGIHLTTPLDERTKAELDDWIIVAEIQFLSLQSGVNITPESPENPAIPDPDARRAEVAAGDAPQIENGQRYPFGTYEFSQLSLPVQLRFSKNLAEGLALGFFIESSVAIFEFPIQADNPPPAFGYSMVGGLSLTIQ